MIIRDSLQSNGLEQKDRILILHTVLTGGSEIARFIVSSSQRNKVDTELEVYSLTKDCIDTIALSSFSIPSINPRIFIFSNDNHFGLFVLGKEHPTVSDNNSISLLLLDSNSIHLSIESLHNASLPSFLESKPVVLKEGNIEGFYGAAVKNDQWIVCYKEFRGGHKCLVGSINLPKKGESIAEEPLISISEISLHKNANHGPKGMGLGCSVKEMKIESIVSGDDSEVDFFVTVLARCPSRTRSPFSIKIFKISSLGGLIDYLHVEKMEYSSAIQTMITSSNNLVMCRDKFSQYPSGTIQSDAEGVWNLSCHEFSLQLKATQKSLGGMEIDNIPGSIEDGSPFKYLALNDFAVARVKVSDYVAGSKIRWDYHNLTNILSYVEIGEAGMRVKNVFFQSPAIGHSIVKSLYIAGKSYIEEVQSVNTFILTENKHTNLYHVVTLDSGKIESLFRGIKFSFESGEYFLSVEAVAEVDIDHVLNNSTDHDMYYLNTFNVTNESAIASPAANGVYILLSEIPTIEWGVDSDGMGNEKEVDYKSGAAESHASSDSSVFSFFSSLL